jgi:uncharacterized protein (DUF1499 family)
MNTALSFLLLVAIFLIALRFFPVDTLDYHVDPADPEPRRSEVRLIGLDAPRFATTADELLETVVRIARSEFGTRLVEGSVDEGLVTFVSRSRVFGFRDFTTIKAVDEVAGAKLAVWARPRGNVYDWGVNTKRLDRWLRKLEQTFDRVE